ncbi:molybdopterin-guanine dinucleotide biosynthesis protein A [Wenyingzhuangia heitensis]|uniref:Probable molybdenum cofactor guanylyltransferase n=1 Tax=Wenyingzhuangia heitensis TaxID=1487859 RepID=A0ABX0U9B9_9FLAO|nr:molybdenum cofactor guanylyltransferase [Wenyingzhuangia heitensis]NIJ44380.1 molybdopterin-guanine dinucleotide biosynthesis protein A [Wenyingzhuangia heitensis]
MQKNITGIILAGGKSSRMGTDKGTLLLNDITFTQHIINNLRPIVDEIIIVSNQESYDQFGVKRISDNVQDYGPVAAVYTGLKESKTDYSLIISCDAPKVDIDVFKPLLEHRNNKYDIVQYICNSRTTPLTALYNRKCLGIFKLALKNKIQKLRFVIKQLDDKTLVTPDHIKDKIVNINTPKDLERHNIC